MFHDPIREGAFWRFADGTLLPVVSGGADEGEAGGDAGAVAVVDDGAGAGADDAGTAPEVDPGVAALERITRETAGLNIDPETGDPVKGTAGATAPADGTDPGDMTYRDAQALRAQQKDYRERFEPFEKAFAGLDAEARAAVLEGAQALGGDMGLVTGAFADLHELDRAVVLDAVAMIQTDPVKAAEKLAWIAQQLAPDAATAPAATAPAPTADDVDLEDLDLSAMTGADIDRIVEERMTKLLDTYRQEAADQVLVNEVLEEARGLGYDTSNTATLEEQARLEGLWAISRRLGGDLNKAHGILAGQAQRHVDEFVEAAAADAARPLPPGTGAPATSEKPLETLGDAEASATARIKAAFGR